jgi:hypothetical protein
MMTSSRIEERHHPAIVIGCEIIKDSRWAMPSSKDKFAMTPIASDTALIATSLGTSVTEKCDSAENHTKKGRGWFSLAPRSLQEE